MRTVLAGAVVAGMVGTIFAAEAGPATAAMTAGGATGVTRVAPATEQPAASVSVTEAQLAAWIAEGVRQGVAAALAEQAAAAPVSAAAIRAARDEATVTHWERHWPKYSTGGALLTLAASANHVAWNNGWLWHSPKVGKEDDGSWFTGNRQERRAMEDGAAPDVPRQDVAQDNGDNQGQQQNPLTIIIAGGDVVVEQDGGGQKKEGLVFLGAVLRLVRF